MTFRCIEFWNIVKACQVWRGIKNIEAYVWVVLKGQNHLASTMGASKRSKSSNFG